MVLVLAFSYSAHIFLFKLQCHFLYVTIWLVCYTFAAIPVKHKAHVSYGWIIGGVGIGLALIVLCIVVCVSLKSSCCSSEARGSCTKSPDGKISHRFQILRKPSFCCASERSVCCKSGDWKQTNGESSSHHITIPKGYQLFTRFFIYT